MEEQEESDSTRNSDSPSLETDEESNFTNYISEIENEEDKSSNFLPVTIFLIGLGYMLYLLIHNIH